VDILEDNEQLDFPLFFNIFLKLYQPQRLRLVFDHALEYYDNAGGPDDFESFLLETFSFLPRSIYRVLQHVLTSDNDEHLEHAIAVIKRLSSDNE
jgi:hypothetical protein